MVQRRAFVLCSLLVSCAAPLRTPTTEAATSTNQAPNNVGQPQTEAQGLALVCLSSTRISQGEPGVFDMRPVIDWVAANVSNREALELAWGHLSWSLAQRAEALAARAKELGLADCPLSEQLALSARIEHREPPPLQELPRLSAPLLTQAQRDLIASLVRTHHPGDIARSFKNGALVQGVLVQSEIPRVIEGHMPYFQRCYQAAIARNPEVQGKMVAYFAIGPDGHVVAVDVVIDNTRNAPLEACMRERFRTFRFTKPIPAGVAFVTYGFRFKIVNY